MREDSRKNMSAFIARLDGKGADDALLDITKDAMKVRLKKKRKDGKGGWHTKNGTSNKRLNLALRKNLEGGDLIDVINIAAMMHARVEFYGKEA